MIHKVRTAIFAGLVGIGYVGIDYHEGVTSDLRIHNAELRDHLHKTRVDGIRLANGNDVAVKGIKCKPGWAGQTSLRKNIVFPDNKRTC